MSGVSRRGGGPRSRAVAGACTRAALVRVGVGEPESEVESEDDAGRLLTALVTMVPAGGGPSRGEIEAIMAAGRRSLWRARAVEALLVAALLAGAAAGGLAVGRAF